MGTESLEEINRSISSQKSVETADARESFFFLISTICDRLAFVTQEVEEAKQDKLYYQKGFELSSILDDTSNTTKLPSPLSRLLQSQRNRPSRTTSQSQPTRRPPLQLPGPRLDLLEPLQQSHEHITRLGKRKLLPDTDSRTTVKRKEFPSDFPPGKTLRSEIIRIFAPEIFAAVHDVDRVIHGCVRGKENRGETVGPAAARDRGGFIGTLGCGLEMKAENSAWGESLTYAAIYGDYRPQTESLVDAVLQV